MYTIEFDGAPIPSEDNGSDRYMGANPTTVPSIWDYQDPQPPDPGAIVPADGTALAAYISWNKALGVIATGGGSAYIYRDRGGVYSDYLLPGGDDAILNTEVQRWRSPVGIGGMDLIGGDLLWVELYYSGTDSIVDSDWHVTLYVSEAGEDDSTLAAAITEAINAEIAVEALADAQAIQDIATAAAQADADAAQTDVDAAELDIDDLQAGGGSTLTADEAAVLRSRYNLAKTDEIGPLLTAHGGSN